MPELPEVEYYRLLAEETLGRAIVKVYAPDAWFLKGGTTAAALRRSLKGRTFTSARRIGKLLLLDTGGGGPTLGLRFGMTGKLVVDGRAGVDDAPATWPTPRGIAFASVSTAAATCASVIRAGSVPCNSTRRRAGWDPMPGR